MVTYQTAGHARRDETANAVCRHYWAITTSDGSISPSTCRSCGVQRSSIDSLEHSPGSIAEDIPSGLDILVGLAKIGLLIWLGRVISSWLSCG